MLFLLPAPMAAAYPPDWLPGGLLQRLPTGSGSRRGRVRPSRGRT
ncbi:hypothetical protein [Pseudoxanthomonas sacheonensis]|nr:hypothetical protein [Pseudoxanthomonas sacheonensis]